MNPMSRAAAAPRVVPAQLDFLAIFNPTLSDSDESLKDQIVFYYARSDHARHDETGKGSLVNKNTNPATNAENGSNPKHEENERLRQIGLAQGMVSFAKNFTNTPVEDIETEKSRIVLHELEKDWWILASIDLTRLPASKKAEDTKNAKAAEFEYSAREVAPAPLLITQLVRANALFLLHNAASLTELLGKVGRDPLCALLDRFWTSFSRNWDVLLHGNPAATIYNAMKLSAGGELGIGVGEEEWGSGEREVLEDFIDRTEGLHDLFVGRYGLPPVTDRSPDAKSQLEDVWLGTGNVPVASDGIIFSGKGYPSRSSQSVLSQWMEEIFKNGNSAYGIHENPSSRARQKRKKRRIDRTPSPSKAASVQEVHPQTRAGKGKSSSLRRQAMENNATPPGIPAPIVSQVEKSLDQAVANVGNETPQSSGDTKSRQQSETEDNNGTSAFASENMMKYLTLGYGTAWTLNPKGLKERTATATDQKQGGSNTRPPMKTTASTENGLQEVDPTPEVSEEEHAFQQKLEQSIGKFLVGLSGDLEQTELDSDEANESDSRSDRPEQRLFLRTLTIALSHPKQQERRQSTFRTNSKESTQSIRSIGSQKSSKDPKTSAAASVDGPQPNIAYEKVQVAVYVHQPFIFVFLFELHTPNLTIPAFYREIHNRLGPLQKPLLRSTDPSKTAARIAEAIGEKATGTKTVELRDNPIYDLTYDALKNTVRTSIPNVPVPGSLAAEGLTRRTSTSLSVTGSWYTLGIPIGNPAMDSKSTSENQLSKSAWSRVEALNAHTQILNTFSATRYSEQGPVEYEHTVKTARGWWVLWMKVLPPENNRKNIFNVGSDVPQVSRSSVSSSTITDKERQYKEAFLVRKAADAGLSMPSQSRSTSSGPGKWLLREQKREVSGASSAGGSASAKGVSDGVGVDARRWIEGLLTLTQ